MPIPQSPGPITSPRRGSCVLSPEGAVPGAAAGDFEASGGIEGIDRGDADPAEKLFGQNLGHPLVRLAPSQSLNYSARWDRQTGEFRCGRITGRVGGEHEAVAIARAIDASGLPDGRLTVRDQTGMRCWLVSSVQRVAARKPRSKRQEV